MQEFRERGDGRVERDGGQQCLEVTQRAFSRLVNPLSRRSLTTCTLLFPFVLLLLLLLLTGQWWSVSQSILSPRKGNNVASESSRNSVAKPSNGLLVLNVTELAIGPSSFYKLGKCLTANVRRIVQTNMSQLSSQSLGGRWDLHLSCL